MKNKKIHLIVVFAILQPAMCDDSHETYSDSHDYNDNTITERVIYSLNELTKLFEEVVEESDHTVWEVREKLEEEYDFIVIGGGSAGCPIANRLTEEPDWTVALMEAGQTETSYMDIPIAAPTSLGGDFDWNFKSVPQQKMGQCLRDRKMTLPRGKCLGGSSCINFMMYCRGNKFDYIFWALLGNIGWSYDEVICYFKKSENAHLKHYDPRYHGKGGYLGVSNSYESEYVNVFTAGGKEIGLETIDYNSPLQPFGLSPMQATTLNGRRDSTGRAFIKPVASRKNLNVFLGAFVTKILIDEKKRAYGVLVEKGGKTYTVRARKEVILSAGAIQTPQVLMLSGIGPKALLEKFNIKCHKHLPGVGQNFKDHLTFYGLVYTIPYDAAQSALTLLLSFLDYVLRGIGPLATIGGIQGVGYIRTPIARTHEGQPDVELMFVGGSMASGLGNFVKTVFGILDECYNSIFKELEGGFQWSVGPLLLHPNSSGCVEIVSDDPHVYPSVDPKYFTDKDNHDVKTMIAGIRESQKLFKTTPFIKYGAKLSTRKLHGWEIAVLNDTSKVFIDTLQAKYLQEFKCDKNMSKEQFLGTEIQRDGNFSSGCKQHKFNSDRYWECALRAIAVTLYHHIGTAKMGPESDPMSVVNRHLQVHGIKDLRVADASVIPDHISGHTNAAAIMIGERAADFVKGSYGKLKTKACDKYGVPSGGQKDAKV